jgi:hypothetical protein
MHDTRHTELTCRTSIEAALVGYLYECGYGLSNVFVSKEGCSVAGDRPGFSVYTKDINESCQNWLGWICSLYVDHADAEVCVWGWGWGGDFTRKISLYRPDVFEAVEQIVVALEENHERVR